MISRMIGAWVAALMVFAPVLSVGAVGELSAVDVSPATLVSGEVTTHTIAFTTPVEWPANGSLDVGYSMYFGVGAITGVSSAHDVSGMLTVTSDGQVVHIVRSGGSPIPAGTLVDDLRIAGVKNAVVVGWGGTYTLTLKDGNGVVLANGVAGQDQFTASQAIIAAPDTVGVLAPNGGEVLRVNEATTVRWEATGSGAAAVRVSVSYDAGNTWHILASGLSVSGSYAWTPGRTASQAKVKVETMLDSATVLREDISDANFRIDAAHGLGELGNTTPGLGELSTTPFPVGTLFRTAESSSLYEVLADGKRYVYPSERVYFTHHTDFQSVVVLPWSSISQAAFGGRMRAAVGTLVKMPSVPVVYRVDAGNVLRPIASETVATRLYGSAWAKRVRDISEVEFVDYTVGASLE